MSVRVGEHHRQAAAFAGLVARDLEEKRGMGDGIEGDEEALRQRQRHRRLFARLKLHQVERHSLDGGLDVLRNYGARAPKDLPYVFGMGKRAGLMRGDAADSWINRERDL